MSLPKLKLPDSVNNIASFVLSIFLISSSLFFYSAITSVNLNKEEDVKDLQDTLDDIFSSDEYLKSSSLVSLYGYLDNYTNSKLMYSMTASPEDQNSSYILYRDIIHNNAITKTASYNYHSVNLCYTFPTRLGSDHELFKLLNKVEPEPFNKFDLYYISCPIFIKDNLFGYIHTFFEIEEYDFISNRRLQVNASARLIGERLETIF